MMSKDDVNLSYTIWFTECDECLIQRPKNISGCKSISFKVGLFETWKKLDNSSDVTGGANSNDGFIS